MRMRAHINPAPGDKFDRAELIEKDERPHHLPLRTGQGAAHLKPARIMSTRHDHRRDGVNRRISRGIFRVERRIPARVCTPLPLVAPDQQRGGPTKAPELTIPHI